MTTFALSKLVAECKEAKVCLSAALAHQEVQTMIETYNSRNDIVARSGVSEMFATLNLIKQRQKPVTRALVNTRLLSIPGTQLSHGLDCAVWALSPSGAQFDVAIEAIGRLKPHPWETKRRVPDQSPNHLSVVTWVSIGKMALLMGADLEEPGDQKLGWSAIVAFSDRPEGRAAVFKIPHHGSSNGHCALVWNDLLEPQPLALLTPWSKGSGLPTKLDISRINALTNNAFSSSGFVARPSKRRSPLVEKQIKETFVGKIRGVEARTGQVRIRNAGGDRSEAWSVEFADAAGPLRLLA
jgi:hypothetical protein